METLGTGRRSAVPAGRHSSDQYELDQSIRRLRNQSARPNRSIIHIAAATIDRRAGRETPIDPCFDDGGHLSVEGQSCRFYSFSSNVKLGRSLTPIQTPPSCCAMTSFTTRLLLFETIVGGVTHEAPPPLRAVTLPVFLHDYVRHFVDIRFVRTTNWTDRDLSITDRRRSIDESAARFISPGSRPRPGPAGCGRSPS